MPPTSTDLNQLLYLQMLKESTWAKAVLLKKQKTRDTESLCESVIQQTSLPFCSQVQRLTGLFPQQLSPTQSANFVISLQWVVVFVGAGILFICLVCPPPFFFNDLHYWCTSFRLSSTCNEFWQTSSGQSCCPQLSTLLFHQKLLSSDREAGNHFFPPVPHLFWLIIHHLPLNASSDFIWPSSLSLN